MYNNIIKKLRDHKSSQCHVLISEDGKEINFVSYTTTVIIITRGEDGKRHIECTGTYSPTTRKQIGWFLKEYAPDLNYFDMKRIAGLPAAVC